MKARWVLATALVASVAAQDNGSYTGYEVLEIMLEDDQKPLLTKFHDKQGYDFWKSPRTSGTSTVVMVEPPEQESFKNFLEDNNVTFSVMIEDVQTVMDEEMVGQSKSREVEFGISFNKYHRLSKIHSYLDELAARYPGTVSVQSIGRSYEGRDLKMARISLGDGARRPVVLLEAGMHAREWIAPAMALYVVQQLAENPAHRDLLRAADWHVLPVLNADGYEFSHTTRRLWRKTRSVIPGSRCRGVDGNRNFNFHWNVAGTSSDPCSEIYAGPRPFSEYETIYLANHMWRHKGRIKMYLALHSYGGFILHPWGYTRVMAGDWKELEEVAEAANAAQVSAGGSSFKIGSASNVLYSASGGSDDWAKAVGGVQLAYTIELPGGGRYGFDLPADRISSTVTSFFPAIRHFGLYAARL